MPKPIENTERVSTYVSKDALEKLQQLAASKGMSMSGYIRFLIMEAVNNK